MLHTPGVAIYRPLEHPSSGVGADEEHSRPVTSTSGRCAVSQAGKGRRGPELIRLRVARERPQLRTRRAEVADSPRMPLIRFLTSARTVDGDRQS